MNHWSVHNTSLIIIDNYSIICCNWLISVNSLGITLDLYIILVVIPKCFLLYLVKFGNHRLSNLQYESLALRSSVRYYHTGSQQFWCQLCKDVGCFVLYVWCIFVLVWGGQVGQENICSFFGEQTPDSRCCYSWRSRHDKARLFCTPQRWRKACRQHSNHWAL